MRHHPAARPPPVRPPTYLCVARTWATTGAVLGPREGGQAHGDDRRSSCVLSLGPVVLSGRSDAAACPSVKIRATSIPKASILPTAASMPGTARAGRPYGARRRRTRGSRRGPGRPASSSSGDRPTGGCPTPGYARRSPRRPGAPWRSCSPSAAGSPSGRHRPAEDRRAHGPWPASPRPASARPGCRRRGHRAAGRPTSPAPSSPPSPSFSSVPMRRFGVARGPRRRWPSPGGGPSPGLRRLLECFAEAAQAASSFGAGVTVGGRTGRGR